VYKKFQKNFSKSDFMKRKSLKRIFVITSSFILIGFLLCSIPANINENKYRELMFSDVVILQVGSDENIILAIQTFLSVYPSGNTINIIRTETEEELYSWLLMPEQASHIIFGHGSEVGLITKEKVIIWINLMSFINSNIKGFVPVMACYSGPVFENYGGVPYAIDAEAAGIYGAYYLDIERNGGESTIDDELLSLAFLKQTIMDHPLEMKVRKWISSPVAASMEVINWKVAAINNGNWIYVDIVSPNVYYWSETKNSFQITKFIPKIPFSHEDHPEIQLIPSFEVIFCIEQVPFKSIPGLLEYVFNLWDIIVDIFNFVTILANTVIAIIISTIWPLNMIRLDIHVHD
jgi:hypothetical protein